MKETEGRERNRTCAVVFDVFDDFSFQLGSHGNLLCAYPYETAPVQHTLWSSLRWLRLGWVGFGLGLGWVRVGFGLGLGWVWVGFGLG